MIEVLYVHLEVARKPPSLQAAQAHGEGGGSPACPGASCTHAADRLQRTTRQQLPVSKASTLTASVSRHIEFTEEQGEQVVLVTARRRPALPPFESVVVHHNVTLSGLLKPAPTLLADSEVRVHEVPGLTPALFVHFVGHCTGAHKDRCLLVANETEAGRLESLDSFRFKKLSRRLFESPKHTQNNNTDTV